MDMKRIRRQQQQHSPLSAMEDQAEAEEKDPNFQKRFSARQLLGRIAAAVATCVLVWVLVFSSSVGHTGHAVWIPRVERLRVFHGARNNSSGRTTVITGAGQDMENHLVASKIHSVDKLLGGLLAFGFDEDSCLSRYQSVMYRKASSHLPSSYLVERLRKYEVLHKRCGPSTDSYKRAIDQLKSGRSSETTECSYVVWISYSGLGNRILSLTSTFLYALLTNRVLLVDRGVDMDELFCEPFPETSWLLPVDFPVKEFNTFDIKSPQSHGNIIKNKLISSNADATKKPLLSYMYLHLNHDYGDFDKLFFCDEEQLTLHKIPWLVLRSNNYFVPSLFLMPTYEGELNQLFPKRDTVFHHLGRYLLHPTNKVWGLITRYYLAYLAKADERVGIQVRVFDTGHGPFQHVLDQIRACSLKERVLPDVTQDESTTMPSSSKTKAVLMASLNAGYFEKIRNMYWEHPASNGEIIGVYQPSHEEYQQTDKQTHNMKAWAEMYLLSMTDVLITSAWSTFGYVAQGLAGIESLIMFKPENKTAPNPPCRRAMSMEPCFHAPPFYDCKAKRGIDTGELVPHVRHCEDMSWGLKLVSQEQW